METAKRAPGNQPIDPQRLYRVIDYIADGKSMRWACEYEGVSRSTLLQYLASDPDLADHYARAREIRGHDSADQIAEISDKVQRGELAPDAARAAMDGLKWTAAKWHDRAYGDRQTHRHEGGIEHRRVIDLSGLSDEELLAWEAMAQKALPSSDSTNL